MKVARRRALVLIAGISLVVLGALSVEVSAATRAEKRDAIQSQLKNAATAEESYRTGHDQYTRVLNDLKTEGFRNVRRVSVLIARAGEGYCIEAQHAGLGEVWHYGSRVGRPVRGGC